MYRFCFVEKNRIDNFARIAAQAPSRQTELISTLFGLDAFADFVKNFTETMDERYIDLTGIKASELRNLTEQLKTKISKGDFSDPNKDNILQPLNSLLGINGDSREWRYLNKGTHDETDRAEFDRGTVNQIITSLEQLDSVLS